ncbi:MAG: phospholipase domain-containing protein [Aliidongia sp.]
MSGTSYDLTVIGPNGFFRRFAGGLATSSANLTVRCVEGGLLGGVTMIVTNLGKAAATLTIRDNYTGIARQERVAAGATVETAVILLASFEWYDVTITTSSDPSFLRHYAGHVETGADGVSDPLLGKAS